MSSFDRVPFGQDGESGFVRSPLVESDGDSGGGFVRHGVDADCVGDADEPGPTLEEMSAESYAQGFEAGRAELPWQETEAVRGLLETLDKALSGVATLRRDFLVDQRAAVVELACAIAEKLVRRTVESDPAVLAGMIERAARTVSDEPKLRIALSSEDFALLQTGMAEALGSFCGECNAELEADGKLARGDVRISGERGDVDGRVGSLLERVKEGLVDLYDVAEETA